MTMLGKIAAGILIFIGAIFWAAVIVVSATGIVYVEVEEKRPAGHQVYLPVPVALAHAALWLVPKEGLREVTAEVAPRRDLILAAVGELADCPDGSLVEFRSSEESFRIDKRDGFLLFDMDTRDERVNVQVPIRSIRNLVSQLATE
jgi:hypothetical protein